MASAALLGRSLKGLTRLRRVFFTIFFHKSCSTRLGQSMPTMNEIYAATYTVPKSKFEGLRNKMLQPNSAYEQLVTPGSAMSPPIFLAEGSFVRQVSVLNQTV